MLLSVGLCDTISKNGSEKKPLDISGNKVVKIDFDYMTEP